MRGARRRKVAADLWTNKLRSLLAIVSLAVGTTAVGALVLAGTTVDSSFDSSFVGANPASAVLMTGPFPAQLVDEVAADPTVDQAEGRRLHQTQVTAAGGARVGVELVAMADFTHNEVARIEPTLGVWPPRPGEIVFERATLGEIGTDMGGTVRVERPGRPPLELTVGGTASDVFEVAPMLGGMPRGYVAMDTIIDLTGSDHLDALYLRATDRPTSGDRASEMIAAVRDNVLTPGGVVIESNAVDEPGEHRAAVGVTFLTVAMQLLSLLALGVAMALVVNTVAALLAQQRLQIGVMKAIGATTRHLMVQYLAYVLALSVAALVIAVPGALLTGRVIAGFLADLANVDLDPVGVPVAVIILQVAVATLLPVASVSLAVRRAARTTVREAITDQGLDGAIWGRNGSSRFARPTVLAYRNAVRNRLRLGLTVVTVSLCGAVLVGVVNTGSALGDLADEVAAYSDYGVAVAFTAPVPLHEATAVLGEAEQVASVEGWLRKQGVHVRPDGTESSNIDLSGVPVGSTAISPTLSEGRWFNAEDHRGIVINADLAGEDPDLAVGERILLEVEGNRLEWRIVGISTTTTVGPVAYMAADELAQVTGQPGFTNLLAIQLTDGADQGDAAEHLGEVSRDAGLPVGQVQTHAEIRETVDSLFGIVVALLLLVGAILAVVAVVGVAGTMTLNVVEQTREIGVLRTIGATTWSVRRLLFSQGLAIAALGAVLGAVLSVPVSLLLNGAIRDNLIPAPVPFTFSWWGVGIWIVVAVTIGTLGATHPSRVASRLTIRDTLAYE